jgi:16S rRNA (guanine527-N7)-methyltransferase
MADNPEILAGKQGELGHRLNELLAQAGEAPLDPETASRFDAYLALLMRWNMRLNLTAIRDTEGILSRHFVESIVCARAIPPGVATLLDLGSGAGFPGIPIALCRPEVSVTLAEAHAKKAAFLQEALRTLSLRAFVYGKRAETLDSVFDCVVLRAVEKMEKAVMTGSRLVGPQGCLVLMTTGKELPGLVSAAGAKFEWMPPVRLPLSEDRLIALGVRAG